MASLPHAFWHSYYTQLHPFILKRVQHPQLAQDLVQEVLLRAYLHMERVQQPEKLNAWMYQIARNVVHDHYRSGALEKIASEDKEAAEVVEEDLTTRLAACIPLMINELPEPYREAVRLADLEGLSQKELATQLGISYSGAKSRVQRGRAKLRAMLLNCCDIQTDAYGNVIDYSPRTS